MSKSHPSKSLLSQSLPATPNLEHLRKQAKDLFTSFRKDDPTAVNLFKQHLPRLVNPDPAKGASGCKLSDAQLVIAREYGFASWPKLKAHVQPYSGQATSPRQQELDDALIRAANKQKDIARVELLLDAGANINGRLSEVGTSALGWAACGGDLELMKFLLCNGADVHALGNFGFSAISGAAMKGHPDAVKLLLAHGAPPNPAEPNGFSLMHSATFGTSGRKEDVVRLLIEAGTEVNVHTAHGHYGAYWFHTPYCGETPLHFAMAYGSKGMIQALLEAGADPRAETTYGETPFHWAGRHQRPKELVKWLQSLL